MKRKHHQLRTVLCGRCKLLSHGHMITAVGGNGGYAEGKQFVTAEQLRDKLSHLRHEKALIVKLVLSPRGLKELAKNLTKQAWGSRLKESKEGLPSGRPTADPLPESPSLSILEQRYNRI